MKSNNSKTNVKSPSASATEAKLEQEVFRSSDETACSDLSSFSFKGYVGTAMTPHYEMRAANEADREKIITAMLRDVDGR